MKKIISIFAISFLTIFIFFITIEYTNLFKNIYDPGRYGEAYSITKKIYLEQNYSESFFDEIHNEVVSIELNQYKDYYIVSPKPTSNKNKYINISDYHNARTTSFNAPIHESKKIVWMFGGSTMFDLGAEDDLTIASTIAKNLNERKIKTHVVNLGMSAFNSSLVRIKFYELITAIPGNELPDEVIFYHGVNDIGHSYFYSNPTVMPHYISEGIKHVVQANHWRLFFYSLEKLFWKSAAVMNFIKKLFIPAHENVFQTGQTEKNIEQNIIERDVNHFIENEKMLNAVCLEYKIKCYFIIQPTIFTKKKLSKIEEKYFNTLNPVFVDYFNRYYEAYFSVQKNYDQKSLINGFDGYGNKTAYADVFHTVQLSSQYIGNKLYELIYEN